MIELNALIIPGDSAAGIKLGHDIDDILKSNQPNRSEELIGCKKYDFNGVSLWVKNNKISQICVFIPYQGTTDKRIGIGSRLEEVIKTYGDIEKGDDDNLYVVGLNGICFETEVWYKGPDLLKNAEAKIEVICVFIHE